MALADLDTLEVEADVAEANVAKLGDGQPAEVTVEAFPDRRYKAVLRQVIPTADRTKATVQVKVTILDKDKDLKPEMSAKVTFLEPEKPTKAAARSGAARRRAVHGSRRSAVAARATARPVVFEVRDGKAQSRDRSRRDAERQGQVVISEGLAGGRDARGRGRPETLKDGDAVRVKG